LIFRHGAQARRLKYTVHVTFKVTNLIMVKTKPLNLFPFSWAEICATNVFL
jgi:hypothetical protein